MSSFAELVRRRESMVRRWTTAGNEVINTFNIGLKVKTDSSQIPAFRGRFSIIDRFYSRFEDLSEELMDLNEDFRSLDSAALKEGELISLFPDERQKTIAKQVRGCFMDCQEINVRYCIVESAAQPIRDITLQNATFQSEGSIGGGASLLPKTPPPKFDGAWELWPHFRDVFVTLVHDNKQLSGIQKFHQLLGALSGDAKSIVSAVPISEAGYESAWKSLKDAYENKRVLATVYLNKLFKFQPLQKPTPDNLRLFLAQISDTVASFKRLDIPNPCDFVLFSLAVKNLPQSTREEFEFKLGDADFPSTEQLATFVRQRQLAVQLATPTDNFKSEEHQKPSNQSKGGREVKGKMKTSLMTNTAPKPPKMPGKQQAKAPSSPPQVGPCAVCSEHHNLFRCARFNNMLPRERSEALNNWSGCRICLNKHSAGVCNSKHQRCRLCDGTHHVMLCCQNISSDDPPTPRSGANLFGTTLKGRASSPGEPQVMLATALVPFRDARGQFTNLRAVLDSGSQYSYITHKALVRLGSDFVKQPKKISCLGGMLFDNALGTVGCEIKSADGEQTFCTEAVVVKQITNFLPTAEVPKSLTQKYLKFGLADPSFNKPGPIHALLGADIFSEIFTGKSHSVGDGLPKVLETLLGFVIMGKYVDRTPAQMGTSLFSLNTCKDNLCFDLQRFWEIEDIPSVDLRHSKEEKLAEDIFVKTYYRLPDGRFGVRLPFTSESIPDLSSSQQAAKRRFLHLETKFGKNPQLREVYSHFMEEYRTLGHMEPTNAPSKYLIPHHAVFNTGKIRVVFDGSASTLHGSLNQYLLVGAPLQNDLRNILINFRVHVVAFVTDCTKMYRQIEVAPCDRAYQHIYWRNDPSEPLQKYELKTVTYGLSCSPFLALRCLKVLEQEHKDEFPSACQALSRDLYVDDVATGHDTIEQALELQRQLTLLFQKGGFSLAKWASNAREILDAVPPESRQIDPVEISEPDSSTLKVLGIRWEPGSDHFSFAFRPQLDVPSTKRAILSTVARIYDPVGILAPVTIKLKILIKKLWLAKLDWDDPIPTEMDATWRRLLENLESLANIQVPRCVMIEKPYHYQLIGFSDASQDAICAVIYVRVSNENSVRVNLLTAKTKVSPTKSLTIPKLELCAATLLARLLNSVASFEKLTGSPSESPILFTDSSVTLAWINKIPTAKLKVFVANRVTEIQNLTSHAQWRHVGGTQNPADLGSRGIEPDLLRDQTLWFEGPTWLKDHPDTWPQSHVQFSGAIPELKGPLDTAPRALFSCSALPDLVEWMGRFSNYRTLLRVMALILRAIHNRKFPDQKRNGEFLLVEITQAFTTCVRMVQLFHYCHGDLGQFPAVAEKHRSLNLFLDENNVIRVGGRLRNAPLGRDQRHPVLLPPNAKFSILMVTFYHQAYLHPNPSLLHALVKQRAWIPHLRRTVRTVTRQCVACFKQRASAVIPQMADLPSFRVTPSRAFNHCGSDFAGPFQCKQSLRRNAPITKMYLCLFVCMVTKALHLEVVSDLSAEGFLAAFTRFISRRGKPAFCYSDNGTNYVGASKELKLLHEWFNHEQTQNAIYKFSAEQDIHWNFTPPYSPHFGGLWESGVRSVKRHLHLVAKDTPMTYEELSTLFCKVEAILNSRPLCPLSDDDPNNTDFLTPGHFLIGSPLLSPPEPTLLDCKLNTLSRWQLVKRMAEEIWDRWRVQYLNTLQRRVKWTRTPSESYLQLGDLVLLKLKDVPVMKWPTGRVIQLHPGDDGVTRVVSVKTPTGIYKRASVNLVPLIPLNQEVQEDDVIPPE